MKRLTIAIRLSVLCLLVTGCGGSGTSGAQSGESNARIVNGVQIDPSELPFVKRMIATSPDGAIGTCSGSFISPNHFLTAAHCVIADGVGAIPPENVSVEIEPGQLTAVAGVAVHPGYLGAAAESAEYPGLIFVPNDIAILLVASPYEGPVIPVSTRSPAFGQTSLIAGYGVTASSELAADGSLRAGVVQIDLVSATDKEIYWFVDVSAESNTCFGDSGGPQLTQFLPEEPLVLVGLTSFGVPNCESGYSGNTLVSGHLDWINLVTGGFHSSL